MCDRSRLRGLVVVLGALLLVTGGCGDEETPEQRLQSLRLQHEITPVGSTTMRDAEGEPTMLVDLRIVNQGTERLPHLSVLIEVKAPDGTIRLSERKTLNLTDLRPGVGEQRTIAVPGFALGEEDQIMVEIESNLAPDTLHSLPEWEAVKDMEK